MRAFRSLDGIAATFHAWRPCDAWDAKDTPDDIVMERRPVAMRPTQGRAPGEHGRTQVFSAAINTRRGDRHVLIVSVRRVCSRRRLAVRVVSP